MRHVISCEGPTNKGDRWQTSCTVNRPAIHLATATSYYYTLIPNTRHIIHTVLKMYIMIMAKLFLNQLFINLSKFKKEKNTRRINLSVRLIGLSYLCSL